MGQAHSNAGRRARHRVAGGGRAPTRGAGMDEFSAGDISGWLAGRLPTGWFEGRDHGDRGPGRDHGGGPGSCPGPRRPGRRARPGRPVRPAGSSRFREETRDERMAIAREAERVFGRSVAWGAEVGGTSVVFTNRSVPVMTRLRQPERVVLDTLVDSGVARSRADALAWCVKLVAKHADEWLQELGTALEQVESVRRHGPSGRLSPPGPTRACAFPSVACQR